MCTDMHLYGVHCKIETVIMKLRLYVLYLWQNKSKKNSTALGVFGWWWNSDDRNHLIGRLTKIPPLPLRTELLITKLSHYEKLQIIHSLSLPGKFPNSILTVLCFHNIYMNRIPVYVFCRQFYFQQKCIFNRKCIYFQQRISPNQDNSNRGLIWQKMFVRTRRCQDSVRSATLEKRWEKLQS